MINTQRIEQQLDVIQSRYNADFDIALNSPTVTYADMTLIDICRSLIKIVNDLQEQINTIGKDLDKAGIPKS